MTIQIAEGLEMVSVDLIAPQGRYRLAVAYLPPRLDVAVLSSACAEISRLADVAYPVLIIGDCNFPEIDWSMCTKPRGSGPQIFLECIITAGLEQLVTEHTRYDSILDLALASHADTVNRVTVVEPFSVSDHNAIDLALQWVEPTVVTETYRDFRATDWTAMRDYLGTVDWAHVLGCCGSVSQCWEKIYFHLQQAVSWFVPSKTYRSSLDVLPLYLRKLRSKRRRLFRQRKNSAAAAAKAASFTASYRRKLRNFCRKQEEQVLSGDSLNSLYKFIRKKTKSRPAIPPLSSASVPGTNQTDADKAEIFNQFFSSVYRNNMGGAVPFLDRKFDSELSMVVISPAMVEKVLARMASKLSCGPDGLPAVLYKQCRKVLALPLALCFQRSLDKGEIPEIWKRTLVVPIFKKGNKSLPTNYRPVSLSCVVVLALERCLKLGILNHLSENNLLSDRQYGFRSGRSVDVQLLTTLNEWTGALDRGYCIDAVYTDFAKAFDTVSHSKLLSKLRAFGIRGKLLTWVTEYFNGRKQSVKLGSCFSSWADVTSGVPQGSVLGPLFFVIFIDDLVSELPPGVKVMLYADDAKLYFIYAAGCWSPLLELALIKLETWSTMWELSLAVPKCQTLYMGNKNSKHVYKLFGEKLEGVSTVRDLGVIISQDLSWFPHVSYLVAKASKRANALLRSFVYARFELLARAFIVYIRPILETASTIWSPYLKQERDLVEKVQRNFSKRLFIKCGLRVPSYPDRLQVLGWSSLQERRERADLVLMFRILKGQVEGAESLYTLHDTNRGLRGNQTKITCSRPRLDLRKYFYTLRVVDKWNELNIDIATIRNVESFTVHLDAL